jgi:sulfur-carrier protein adenylyltransferase/sulfurtransferase
MNPDFLRYSCQIALPGFSEQTQLLMQKAKVLIVGAGGLGCPAAQYLAASGIGTLGIVDFDVVAEGNLHRQILYGPADIGKKKAIVACERLQQQNPGIHLIAHDLRLSSKNIIDVISNYDVIVDCTDNFDTRYLLNDASVITGKPLVYAAIYQFEGQVAVWNVAKPDGQRSPNYRDLFPQVDASQIPDCAEGGVIPTLAGIIGCVQANEVIKYITKTGELLEGKILMFDAQILQSRIIKIGTVTQTNINKLTETIETPVISAVDLKKDLEENTIQLIDVRTAGEREKFNIGGIHVPLEQISVWFENADKDKKTALYCASGKRSGEAVNMLKNRFPDANIFSLSGGTKAWI